MPQGMLSTVPRCSSITFSGSAAFLLDGLYELCERERARATRVPPPPAHSGAVGPTPRPDAQEEH